MSESLPPDQLAGITKRLEELGAAVAELKAASTPREKKEAQADVDSAENALEKYAKSHGISLEEAEEAMEQVKRQSQRRLVKEALKEMSEEDWTEIFPARDETEEEPEPEKKPATRKPVKQEEDSAPGGEHWTDRPVFTRGN
jgi:hypothetical protein